MGTNAFGSRSIITVFCIVDTFNAAWFWAFQAFFYGRESKTENENGNRF